MRYQSPIRSLLKVGEPFPSLKLERSCHECYFDTQTLVGCIIHSDRPEQCAWYTMNETPPKKILDGFATEVVESRILNRGW